jgi:hypothetical protein
MLGAPAVRHWVLVVSLDSRNLSEQIDSVLIVPFGSQGAEGPTTLRFEPGETGPSPSWLKGRTATGLQVWHAVASLYPWRTSDNEGNA